MHGYQSLQACWFYIHLGVSYNSLYPLYTDDKYIRAILNLRCSYLPEVLLPSQFLELQFVEKQIFWSALDLPSRLFSWSVGPPRRLRYHIWNSACRQWHALEKEWLLIRMLNPWAAEKLTFELWSGLGAEDFFLNHLNYQSLNVECIMFYLGLSLFEPDTIDYLISSWSFWDCTRLYMEVGKAANHGHWAGPVHKSTRLSIQLYLATFFVIAWLLLILLLYVTKICDWLTCLERVDAVICIEFLCPVFLSYCLTKDSILVYKIHRLFLLLGSHDYWFYCCLDILWQILNYSVLSSADFNFVSNLSIQQVGMVSSYQTQEE